MSDWGKDIIIDKEAGIISKASPASKGEYPKRMTNYERIKNMSIEEIGNFIRRINVGFDPWCKSYCYCDDNAFANCNDCLDRWLESEVEE